jgi:hypothetical protein
VKHAPVLTKRLVVLALSAAVLCIAACSGSNNGSAESPASVSASDEQAKAMLKPTVPDEKAAVARVTASIVKNKLTRISPDCLSFIPYTADAQGFVVDVHELHDSKCAGDPQTQPRLFSFMVDRMSGRMQTDATDPSDGLFHPID